MFKLANLLKFGWLSLHARALERACKFFMKIIHHMTDGRGGPEPLRPAARAPRDAQGFLVHQEKGAMLTAANMHVAKKSMSTLFRNACCIIDMHVA